MFSGAGVWKTSKQGEMFIQYLIVLTETEIKSNAVTRK